MDRGWLDGCVLIELKFNEQESIVVKKTFKYLGYLMRAARVLQNM